VLCGSQLFIHGGHTGVNPLTAPIGSDLYSIDVSGPFNSFAAPWVQLNPGPYAAFHSVGLMGSGNDLLAVYGGNTSFIPSSSSSSSTVSNSLNLYNTATSSWAASTLQDPPRREEQTAVSRLGDGTMFIFGGMVLSSDLLTETPTAELWSLGGYLQTSSSSNGGDSLNSTSSTATATATAVAAEKPTTTPIPPGLSPGIAGWQKLIPGSGSSSNGRSSHTATLVRSNGLLVVIGGVAGGALVSMSEILVYDTAAGVWSVQTATGATPPLRRSHVAAANSNGQIYIHGGTDFGGTTFFADVAILDTTSWSWIQPAFEGVAPTGRYSHSAAMVGSNMVITFGLTAGGATNNIYILDTITNTWVSSYTPNNLQFTSTKPEDWPGYKPPPVLPSPPDNGADPDHPPGQGTNKSHVGPIIGGIVGFVAVAALVLVVIRRHRRKQFASYQSKTADYYGRDFLNQRDVWQQGNTEEDAAYLPRGMAFTAPVSFGQRMEQLWGDGMTAMAFWRDKNKNNNRRAANRSQSHRMRERDDDESSMRGLQEGPMPSDQEIFMDAVHRARSRIGRLSPIFTPLQQPINTPGSPTSPRSPRHSVGSTGFGGATRGSGTGSDGRSSGIYVPSIPEEDEGDYGRAYSDGFENAMQEMDVQMLAVPRGRLYVVNPSDEALAQEQGLPKHQEEQAEQVQQAEQAYRHFDSHRPRE
ncbi:hypothetical protein BGX28_010258, partial [Mortierella sp. GBA30]